MQNNRDTILDGFRAYAVMAVVAGHAMAYRYADQFEAAGVVGHRLRELSGPLADFGVYLFFGISGYIITHLLLREEKRKGRISIGAFYIRRTCRILPPLLAYLITLFLLDRFGTIATPVEQLPRALFTCNLDFGDCDWFTAHTWSLAVEEQFYLFWPIIFLFASIPSRIVYAGVGMAILVGIYSVVPWVFHSNPLSFACIAAGVAMALRPQWRQYLADRTGSLIWCVAVALAVLGPKLFGYWLTGLLMPAIIVIVLFGSYGLTWLHPLLTNRVAQWVAAMSYSLYLWQQLFLASPERAQLPVLLLPIAAYVSMVLVERPFMRLSHKLSRRMTRTTPSTTEPEKTA
ncbi:MAG: acyltransferase [Pontixanthobacter sp.]